MFVLVMIQDLLGELDCRIVGPAATVAEALAIAESGGIDAALLISISGMWSPDIPWRTDWPRDACLSPSLTGYSTGELEGRALADRS